VCRVGDAGHRRKPEVSTLTGTKLKHFALLQKRTFLDLPTDEVFLFCVGSTDDLYVSVYVSTMFAPKMHKH